LAVGFADGVEVAEAMDDHEIGDAEGAGQLPLGLHAGEERRLTEKAPSLVVDHPSLSRGGVGEGGLHPCRGAGHHEGNEGVGAADAGEVEADHREGGVESDGGGSVEETGQVAVDEAGEGVPGVAAVVAELGDAGPCRVTGGVEEMVDHGRERRGCGGGDGAVEGGVEGGVFDGGEGPVERGLGERTEQHPPALGGFDAPLLVAGSASAGALVERVEP
jgi:hypothetical protein